MDEKNTTAVNVPSPGTQQLGSEGVFANTSEQPEVNEAMQNKNLTTDEQLTEKSKNRFQELANQNRDLQEQLANYKAELLAQQEYQRQLQHYLASLAKQEELQEQAEQVRQTDLNTNEVLAKLALKLEKLEREKLIENEKKMWDEAIAAHPEIEQDPLFDNLVYSTYKTYLASGYNVTPKQIADQIKKYMGQNLTKKQEESYKKAQADLSRTMSSSLSVDNTRTQDISETENILERIKKGDSDAWIDAFSKKIF